VHHYLGVKREETGFPPKMAWKTSKQHGLRGVHGLVRMGA